ncbi:MAG: hypothetical protein HFF34_03090 [Oscillospiraceae bacterium]|jgi:hypothetical protein|nr:hypothetical protein [Oscillospiraceae bacterium]MCI9580346.1 hypothetical protein [Oscillospiraceae bacterium]
MEQIPAQLPGNTINGVDPATFQRVWNRVMPDQSLSPIEMDTIEPVPPEQPIQPIQPIQPPETIQPIEPVEPAPPEVPDLPDLPEPPSVQLLPALMDQLYAAWQRSQCLTRQTSGSVNRVFANSAEEQRRGLKRLSAAYFLQSGQWYTPGRTQNNARMGQSRTGGLPNLLRERYQWERQWEQTCRQAAQAVQDEAVRSLLNCLAQEAAGRAGQIRTLLEQTVRFSC